MINSARFLLSCKPNKRVQWFKISPNSSKKKTGHVRIHEMEAALTGDGLKLFEKDLLDSARTRCIEGTPG